MFHCPCVRRRHNEKPVSRVTFRLPPRGATHERQHARAVTHQHQSHARNTSQERRDSSLRRPAMADRKALLRSGGWERPRGVHLQGRQTVTALSTLLAVSATLRGTILALITSSFMRSCLQMSYQEEGSQDVSPFAHSLSRSLLSFQVVMQWALGQLLSCGTAYPACASQLWGAAIRCAQPACRHRRSSSWGRVTQPMERFSSRRTRTGR